MSAPSTPVRVATTAPAAASPSPPPGLSPWVAPTPSGRPDSPGSAVITNTPAGNPGPVAPTNARNARNDTNDTNAGRIFTTTNRLVAPPSSLMAAFNAAAREGGGAAGGAAGGDPVAGKEKGDLSQHLEPLRIKKEGDFEQSKLRSRKQGGGSRKLRKSKAKARKAKKSKSKKSKKNVRRN